MKKISIISLTVFLLSVCAFGQQSTDTQKNSSQPTIQTLQSSGKNLLGKKTSIITPKGTTNWSKIKDLFK